jgi:NADP-dependent alcohol dehydrogenase
MTWSWHVATIVVAGEEATVEGARLAAGHGRRALLVTDAGISRHTDLVGRWCSSLAANGVAVRVHQLVGGTPDRDGVCALTDVLRAEGVDVVVAVGGGSVMDSAKLAALAVRQPSVLRDGWDDPGGLLVPELRASRRALPSVAAPTTIGTGSEVSPSASVRTEQAKKLLVHLSLRPTLAVLDPAATATTPRRLVVEGALEVLLRAIGPLVGDSAPEPFSDRVAAAVARQVVHDGGVVAGRRGTVDTDEIAARHRLALASAHTHTGWLLAGRDSFGHKLWYLANETAVALGVTKMQATSALLPTYLDYLGRGRFPGTSVRRLDEMAGLLEVAPGDLPAAAGRLLSRWALPSSLSDIGAESALVGGLARSTYRAWGPPHRSLLGFDIGLLEEFYSEAIGRIPTVGARSFLPTHQLTEEVKT